jgi:hypothetical protein
LPWDSKSLILTKLMETLSNMSTSLLGDKIFETRDPQNSHYSLQLEQWLETLKTHKVHN